MAFVRIKRINGQDYCYLVENSWTQNGARQKVGKYLGKVHRPERTKNESLAVFLGTDASKHVLEKDFMTIAEDLVKLELHNHNVSSEDFAVSLEGLSVKDQRGREVAIAMNDGFLCSHTLKRLLEYKSEEDYSGYVLADLITAAGLAPEQSVFIQLYGKFQKKQDADAEKPEFYY